METPRRNIKQELLVALVTLVILATAVGLAVVLTGDSLAAFRQTSTPVGLAPVTASSTPTVESLQATSTPTSSATRPATAPATAPAAASATASAAASPAPSLTPGKPAPVTSTSATPVAIKPSPIASSTATPTTRPTRTPVPRITSVPTGITPTATTTRPPTVTPSTTLAPTLTAPTATPTPSATPWPTPLPPTPTIVLATPITPTAAAAACTPPADWRPYTIRSGENLFRISLRAGVPLAEMQRVNCIPNAANIIAGQVIYVPPTFFYSNAPTSPIQAQETVSSIPRQAGCSVPGIQIAYPAPGAVLSSRFAVTGSATLEDSSRFSFYKVELRAENETVFHNVGQSNQPVTGGTLATIDPAAFGPGHYQLKLTVVDITGNYPQPCAIRVTFR